ncbi:MAG: SDR family NAD(P)-dependent oxidoreductase [Actinomycetota bacterium]
MAICARQEEELRAAAEELGSGGESVYSHVCDVTDPTQVADFVARSAEALGGIDILVNPGEPIRATSRPSGTKTGRPTSTSSCSR